MCYNLLCMHILLKYILFIELQAKSFALVYDAYVQIFKIHPNQLINILNELVS